MVTLVIFGFRSQGQMIWNRIHSSVEIILLISFVIFYTKYNFQLRLRFTFFPFVQYFENVIRAILFVNLVPIRFYNFKIHRAKRFARYQTNFIIDWIWISFHILPYFPWFKP